MCLDVKVMHVNLEQPFCCVEKYIKLISAERQDKISRFQFDKDKIVSLYSELLMRREISNQLNILWSSIEFHYNEYGKPCIINYPEYQFSLSHSGNCIVFIGGIEPVGIDVEKITCEDNVKIADRFFTSNECDYIKGSNMTNITFYKVWTAKEAYVKMLGYGLSKSFNSFDIFDEYLGCQFIPKIIEGYLMTVCVSRKKRMEELKINLVTIDECSVI